MLNLNLKYHSNFWNVDSHKPRTNSDNYASPNNSKTANLGRNVSTWDVNKADSKLIIHCFSISIHSFCTQRHTGTKYYEKGTTSCLALLSPQGDTRLELRCSHFCKQTRKNDSADKKEETGRNKPILLWTLAWSYIDSYHSSLQVFMFFLRVLASCVCLAYTPGLETWISFQGPWHKQERKQGKDQENTRRKDGTPLGGDLIMLSEGRHCLSAKFFHSSAPQ